LFGLGWFLSILILLSFLQYKRADYLLPAYPGLALAVGVSLSVWLDAATQTLRKRYLQGGMIGLAVLMLGWLLYTEMFL
ncbi:MAG TPA: hypothetical protein PKA06_12935, partial [Gemmatales bacterium]|nr:hypothetical protein [Gemmatales bacterium]